MVLKHFSPLEFFKHRSFTEEELTFFKKTGKPIHKPLSEANKSLSKENRLVLFKLPFIHGIYGKSSEFKEANFSLVFFHLS